MATALELRKNPLHYLPLAEDLEEVALKTGTGGEDAEVPALHALAVTQKFEIRVWSKSNEGLWKLYVLFPKPLNNKKKHPVVWLLLQAQHYEWLEPFKTLKPDTINAWMNGAMIVKAGLMFGGGGGGRTSTTTTDEVRLPDEAEESTAAATLPNSPHNKRRMTKAFRATGA